MRLEIRYKPSVQNSKVDSLSRLYNISEIKDYSYSNFIERIKTQLIINKRVNEVIRDLINIPVKYNLVSEIAKQ